MKSIMEEASSVGKAIEKGWTNAGKPNEFSIKVYEEPEKNFIGMTVKSAKIGIFFTEPKKVEPKPRKDKEKQPKARAPKPPEPKEKKEDLGPIWNDEMVASTKEWVGAIIQMLDLGTVSFTIEPQRFHLRIEFASGVLDDKDRQKHLFAVMSNLLLTMLKRRYKRPLRGYKIVLTEG